MRRASAAVCKEAWSGRKGKVKLMYEIGALIIYGSEGVCQVQDIGSPNIPAINPERTYYTLNPIYREGVIYTPVDSRVFMRPVISKVDAERLVEEIPTISETPCEEKNLRFLAEHYDKFLQSHNCADLVQLIKSLYQKKQRAALAGKKPGAVDERYMKRAEELLYGELAAVLEISRETVLSFIKSSVEDVNPAV